MEGWCPFPAHLDYFEMPFNLTILYLLRTDNYYDCASSAGTFDETKFGRLPHSPRRALALTRDCQSKSLEIPHERI